MKTKLVLWGSDANNEKVLMALELRPEANKVDIYTFPQSIIKDDFTNKMMEDWRNGTEVAFPEGFTHIERELAIADSILPDELKADRPELMTRAQTEWHFLVLSTKLNEVYRTELDELKEKVDGLTAYSGEMWDTLKGFWDKVQSQVQERNLFREHADLLRDGINELFGKLKDMRVALNNEFETKSKEAYDKYMAALDTLEEKIKSGPRSAANFEELKQMQSDYRTAAMTREHRASVWERLDATFKLAKGESPSAQSNGGANISASTRIQNRLDGLNAAIAKMEVSVQRDKEELDFQKKKIATTDGQLEMQIRQAKLRMIEERYNSKKEKLDEMVATRLDVEKSLTSAKDKEEKRAKGNTNIQETNTAAEEAVAAAVQTPAPSIGETVEQIVEDTVDTVKAVAEVAAEKVESIIESLTASSNDKKEEEA
jgi:hypothetical protein